MNRNRYNALNRRLNLFNRRNIRVNPVRLTRVNNRGTNAGVTRASTRVVGRAVVRNNNRSNNRNNNQRRRVLVRAG